MSLLKTNEIQVFNGTTVTITATTTETSADLNVGADLDVTGALTLGTALAIAEGGTGATTASGARVALDLEIGVDVEAYSATNADYADATANFTGTLQNGGSNVLVDTDIGSTVQAYDADTAKYDAATANFTGTLQNGGSNVVVDSDIGSTVQAYDADTTKNDVSNTFTANQIISVADNTNAALRITQLGTGNAFVVEDSANPDATPFVIDANGKVVIGDTSSVFGGDLEIYQSTSGSFCVFERYSANANGYTLALVKTRGSTPSAKDIVSSGDGLGSIAFQGTDGTTNLNAALITAQVDGTPGANDMPGRLVFSTTADGASSPTERMRIDSSGNVGIGTSSPTQKLDVSGNINATGALTLGTALAVAEGGTGVTSLGSLDAADLGSGAATDGYVLTADGAGGAAWEAASGGGGTTAYVEHSSSISDSFTLAAGTNRMYIGGTTFSGTITVAGRLAIVAGPANFTGTINVTGTLATV